MNIFVVRLGWMSLTNCRNCISPGFCWVDIGFLHSSPTWIPLLEVSPLSLIFIGRYPYIGIQSGSKQVKTPQHLQSNMTGSNKWIYRRELIYPLPNLLDRTMHHHSIANIGSSDTSCRVSGYVYHFSIEYWTTTQCLELIDRSQRYCTSFLVLLMKPTKVELGWSRRTVMSLYMDLHTQAGWAAGRSIREYDVWELVFEDRSQACYQTR